MAYESQVPYVKHGQVDPRLIGETIIGLLEHRATLPNLFARQSIDAFKGTGRNRTVNYQSKRRVLPWRRYQIDNDRTNPIVFDPTDVDSQSVALGDHIYSASRVTDEQRDFDEMNPSSLMVVAAEAVMTGITKVLREAMDNIPWEVKIGAIEGDIRGAIIEAKQVLDAFHVSEANRILLVGRDVETLLLTNEKLNLTQNVAQQRSENALARAEIGDLFGFRVVRDLSMAPGEAFAMVGDALVLFTGPPSVPAGAPVGTTVAHNGYGLRWMQDYETTRMMDRVVCDTWLGVLTVKDHLYSDDAATEGQLPVQTANAYFLRGVKLTIGGTSDYPAAAGEVGSITGITDASVWTPTGRKAETAQ